LHFARNSGSATTRLAGVDRCCVEANAAVPLAGECSSASIGADYGRRSAQMHERQQPALCVRVDDSTALGRLWCLCDELAP
jgi:hypothetical protein